MRDRMLEARELVEGEKISKRELTSGMSICKSSPGAHNSFSYG